MAKARGSKKVVCSKGHISYLLPSAKGGKEPCRSLGCKASIAVPALESKKVAKKEPKAAKKVKAAKAKPASKKAKAKKAA